MNKILCTVQAGQFSDAQIKTLEALLRRHYASLVSTGPVSVIWGLIPKGQAYTDYQPSQSSLVTMECAVGFSQEKRVALLQACAQDWLAETGQHSDHLLLSLVEADRFKQLLDSNQDRLSPLGRLQFVLHMLTSLLRSKLSKGYLSFNPNL
ncbi:MAG: hypothetical protein ACPHER_02885 [Nevskiales bacterium]